MDTIYDNLNAMSRRKALGQHFLRDPGILQKIIQVIAPVPEETIIEIGAGKGALTFSLAEKGSRITAIEKDPAFIAALKDPDFPNLKVLEADVLDLDLRQIVSEPGVKIAGNLPYSISSPILFKVLDSKELFSSCVFLIQKEVADRLCAEPGTKKYAPLSILFENDFIRKRHFTVPPEAFSPPPKVESALISLTKREAPLFQVKDESGFRRFLKTSFAHRRKTLFNNLRQTDRDENTLKNAINEAGLDRRVRAEAVSLAQFIELYSTAFL